MSTRTRFPELSYRNDAPGLWRIVTTEDDAAVGPQYGTKAELLADLGRYAAEYGCDGVAASAHRTISMFEYDSLRADNTRLREALVKIQQCYDLQLACDIAFDALAPGDGEGGR